MKKTTGWQSSSVAISSTCATTRPCRNDPGFFPKRVGQVHNIEQSILLIRGEKVILDNVLASMYGVSTKVLLQAVKRNARRFPSDFMYQLSPQEVAILRSQFVTSSWGGRRKRPHAFTEQGVSMLSSVLRSERAVLVNVEIMRTFVRLRRMLVSHADFARKLDELEDKYDSQFRVVFDAIRQLMQPTTVPKQRRIGFRRDDD